MRPYAWITGSLLGGLTSAIFNTCESVWHHVSGLVWEPELSKHAHTPQMPILSIGDKNYCWQDNPLLAMQMHAALAFLERRNSIIAKGALSLIKSGRIKIAHFKDLSPRDYEVFKELDLKGAHLRKTPEPYPPSEVTIHTLEKKMNGAYCYPNHLYISSKLKSQRDIAETLVHELSHYLHAKRRRGSSYDEFMDEMRSFLVEEIVSDVPIRRSTVQWVYEHVKKSYPELKAPPKATLPEDIYLPFVRL